MKTLDDKLKELVDNGTIKCYIIREQLPTIEGDKKSGLADELFIAFNNGESLFLTTFCSGCLENTSIRLKE